MNILINGLEKTVDLTEVKSLDEALGVVLEKDVDPGHIITQVVVNGKELPLGKESAGVKVTFEEIRSLAVTTSPSAEVIAESLAGGIEYINEIKPIITRVAELYRLGKDHEANQTYAQCVEALQRLINSCEVIKTSVRLVREDLQAEKMMVLEGKGSILELLKELLKVQSDRDWILLADLLEYELVPLLQNWSQELSGLQANLQK